MRIRATATSVAGLALVACVVTLPFATGAETGIEIPKYGVGTGVVDRELEGETETFEEETQAFFWTLVTGGKDGDRIQHVWLHEGTEVVSVGLSIGGAHWRTYSRKNLYKGSVGSWVVEARDADGNVLASSEFTVTEAVE
jgi:hypothetical protein